MIKLEHVAVMNIENALRGMRNPLESWDKSDSKLCQMCDDRDRKCAGGCFSVGPNDRALMCRLAKAGTDHRKFLRQIFVSMDITAPMSWWWDFDTYKVSTTKNSCSRMHKLGSRLLTKEDFSYDDEFGDAEWTPMRQLVLNDINDRITKWQQMDNSDPLRKALWRTIMLDLPASYNFLSTWTGTYENLINVYFARRNHKQREFREFCAEIRNLPYMAMLLDAIENKEGEKGRV